MKKYFSKVIVGCLGICAGFALCYFTLVDPNSSRLSASLKQQAAHGNLVEGDIIRLDPWGNPYVVVYDRPSARGTNH